MLTQLKDYNKEVTKRIK